MMETKNKTMAMSDDKTSGIRINVLRHANDFPSWLTLDQLAKFIYENIKPYEDTLEDTKRAVEIAVDPDRSKGAFILLAEDNQKPIGALIMLRTGMKGYVPENILLMVCVHPKARGKGIGGTLIKKGIDLADGDVKLHVEYDNPAKQVYEKIGFTTKYAEMRFVK